MKNTLSVGWQLLMVAATSMLTTAMAAPSQIKDINAGPLGSEVSQTIYGSSRVQTTFMSLGNGKAVVLLEDGSGLGLFVTDGSSAGTSKLASVPPTTAVSVPRFVLNGFVYFWLGDAPDNDVPAEPARLWRSDGTVAGTGEFQLDNGTVFTSNPVLNSAIAKLGNKLVFAAGTAEDNEKAVWISDGTSAGTYALSPYCNGGYGNPSFSDLNSDGLNGYQYFSVVNCGGVDTGTELWRTDGSDIGTSKVASISANSASVPPTYMKYVGQKVFFRAQTDDTGQELWVSDGTADGTYMVTDLFPGGISSRPTPLMSIGDRVLFSGTSDMSSREYWSSNGDSVEQLTFFGTVDQDGYIGSATAFAGKVYFTATANNGMTTWLVSTDGTDTGTAGVIEMKTIGSLAVLGSKLYFQGKALTDSHGIELWESDGTAANTKLTADIFSGASNSSPHSLQALSDTKLLFMADGGNNGIEPWLYDVNAVSAGDSSSGSGGGGSVPFFMLGLGIMLFRLRQNR